MALSGDISQQLTTAVADQLLAVATTTQLEIDSGSVVSNDSSLHSSMLIDNTNSALLTSSNRSVTTEFIAEDVETSPLVLYIAVFVSLGGVIVLALVAVLIWCWCRRLTTRDRRLLNGVAHGMNDGTALTEAQKKEALFKEIRRDIAAVENDGFLRHLEVYMLPQQHGASSDTGWEYRSHRHHHHHIRHSGVFNQHRNSPSVNHESNSNSFLVTSPLSSSSGCGDGGTSALNVHSAMITRSSTMTTTASSLSSYSSSSSSTGSGSSHRNHIPKRNSHGYGPPSIHDRQWDEEDDLVNEA